MLLLLLWLLCCSATGFVCLVVFALKRKWKAVGWTVESTLGAWGLALGLVYLVSTASDLRLHRPVAAQEVVGTWDLSADSIAMAGRVYYDKPYLPAKSTVHQLELRADGTCRFRSLLDWTDTRYVDCAGTWKVRPDGNSADISELELNLNLKRGFSTSLQFGEEDGKLFIWTNWLDPDGGDILRYERRISSGP